MPYVLPRGIVAANFLFSKRLYDFGQWTPNPIWIREPSEQNFFDWIVVVDRISGHA